MHVRLEATSAGLSPLGEVLNPDGTRACAPTTADESTCLLSASGTYTILAGDATGTGAGDYAIAVQRLPNGTIANDAETDCYRFAAATGDRVHLRLESTSAGLSPAGEVLNPDGTRACPPTTARRVQPAC